MVVATLIPPLFLRFLRSVEEYGALVGILESSPIQQRVVAASRGWGGEGKGEGDILMGGVFDAVHTLCIAVPGRGQKREVAAPRHFCPGVPGYNLFFE